jgi:alkylated DNA repair protein (DNA oxidative demethylase)
LNQLYKGAYHFDKALTDDDKLNLLKLYQDNKQFLYIPKLKNGHSMNLKMTCFGKHWNPIDYKYYDTRVDFDSSPVKPMPTILNEIATKFSKQYFPNYENNWDICIMNYYRTVNRLGVHQDNSESRETLQEGHPVVSFSIGADCLFFIGGFNRKDEGKTLVLKNGDVFIFGGKSRLRYHGVMKLLSNNSEYDVLEGGRVNFTLRKY